MKTIYYSDAGSDSNSGLTLSQPKRSLLAALEAAGQGGTVVLATEDKTEEAASSEPPEAFWSTLEPTKLPDRNLVFNEIYPAGQFDMEYDVSENGISVYRMRREPSNGFWVVRDPTGRQVARDQYRHDLFESLKSRRVF